MRPRLPALALLGCVVAGLTCVYAPPVSFSQGKRWTFPLVDPLRGGKLLTPVMVDGRGPFLVALDPAAKQTTVDREVVSDNWGEKLKPQVELANVVLGDLTINPLEVAVSTVDGKLDTDNRRIFGVIGADVLTDELVFGFDRGSGIAWLSRFDALDNVRATRIDMRRVAGHWRVAATVGGRPVDLEVQLGEATSQLGRALWGSAGVDSTVAIGTVVDRTGARRSITERGVARSLVVGGVHHDGLSFVPYDGSDGGDGTLGLDFFEPYGVDASWPDRVLFLRAAIPADTAVTARLARWGRQMLDACHTPGCVDLAIVTTERDDGSERVERKAARPYFADLADGPPATYAFHATRDPITAGTDLQVVFATTGSDGKPLPSVEVDIPSGADNVTAAAEPRFAAATFKVVDVSPFPRVCGRGPTGCVVLEPSATP